MKVCFFGIYDPEYSRSSVLLRGLRQNGAEVIECRADWRDPKRYKKLWRQLRALDNAYDCIFAAYPASVPVILAKLLSKRPVIIDAFYSNFDSVVNDRKKYSRWSPRSVKLLVLDWLGVILADLVITDTRVHERYWRSWFGMRRKKMGTVYVGVDDKMFFPMEAAKKDHILVLFMGTFIPLQGSRKIVEAAYLCSSDPKIRFRFIGDGRDFPPAKRLAEKLKLQNSEFIGMIPLAELNSHIAEADIVLGIFGDTAKAGRVIPNKVYEGLYAGRAVMTMDNAVIREIFSPEDMLLVRNDPQSMADGIKLLAKDRGLRAEFARRGHEAVSRYVPSAIGRDLLDIVSKNMPNV